MSHLSTFAILVWIIVGVVFVSGCSNSGTINAPETAKEAIIFNADVTSRTNILASSRTYTVQGTFTNNGREAHTFWGGVAIFDENYITTDYKGTTIALNPGESITITEDFIVDIAWKFKGTAYSIR